MVQQLTAIIGILLSIILLTFNYRKRPETMYLGLFFTLLSLYNFSQYVITQSNSEFLVSIVYIHTGFIGYLIGPLLFFYVRNSLSDLHKFRKTDYLHFIPALIMIIASYKYIFLPWELKEQIAGEIINDKFAFIRFNREYIGWLIPTKFNVLFRYVSVLFYSIFSIRLVYLKDWKNVINQKIKTLNVHSKWLLFLLSTVALLSLTQTIVIIKTVIDYSLQIYQQNTTFHLISGTLLMGTILLPFFYPSVLYGIGNFYVNKDLSEKIKSQPEIETKTNDIVINHEFDIKYMNYIGTLVNKCMEIEKPYLQKDCNIGYLAKILNIPGHHLLYYFREIKQQSFNDYRNEWRVIHAKKLIDEIKTKDYTIEAIGLLSGFTSKNAFFVAFKKFTGLTPGAYSSGELGNDE